MNNYTWREAGYYDGSYDIGRWLKNDSEEKEWKNQLFLKDKEFVKEFNQTDEYKVFILDKIKELQDLFNLISSRYLRSVSLIGKDMADLLYEIVGGKEIEKQLQKAKNDFLIKNNTENGKITEEMIKIARDHPIEALISTNPQGFTRCPFHNEETPSFHIFANKGHCFGCLKTVDTIQLLRDRDGLSFVEAVLKLQN